MSDLNNIIIGNIKVTVLEDGYLNLPKEVLKNISPDIEKTLINNAESDLVLSNINTFLIEQNNEKLLVDAGCRDIFGPTCGFFPEQLEKAGTNPEEITDSFFTHLHPDHVGGAITKDGKPVFVNASVKIPEKEIDFWNRDDFEDVEANGKSFADLAKSLLNAYDGKVISVSNEDEIIKNVHVVDLPGHTPGHSGFRIDDANESFINLGDILHVPNIQLENPNISLLFDVDMEQGLKTRKKLFDMVSTDKLLCSGGHMLAPKFGYIEKSGTGYKFSE